MSRYTQLALAHDGEQSLEAELVKLAYEWQTSFGNGYSTEPTGDPVQISTTLISKWGRFFSACDGMPPV